MYLCHMCSTEYSKTEKQCPSCDTPIIVSVVSDFEMVAVHAVTVEFEIDKKKQTVSPNIGSLWPLDGEDVSYKFIQQVELKFERKNKFHGYYEKDTETNIPRHLAKYFNSLITEDDFKNLVNAFCIELKNAIHKTGVTSKATSSKIVFMHYKSAINHDFGRVLAVMVDKKSGFDFTDGTLLPKSAEHINLDALKQAVSIDIDQFDCCYPEAPTNEAYLKFIRGSSSADYFRIAFGCIEKSDNGLSLENLYSAITQFGTSNNLSQDFIFDAEDNLTEFLDDLKKSNNSSFSISQAAFVIEKALPAEAKVLESSFIPFVNQNKLMINQYIEPTSNQIKNKHWVDFSDSANGLIAKLHESNDIGFSGDGYLVEYNRSTKRLEIRVQSQPLRDKIERMIISGKQHDNS
ncbi:nucleoid-associated protein [Aliivibrio fischeri]|uniref:nucleoid-associated protein n=1 Tax=Aliivibrio fischeri TaxID=668 RepID=UPI0018C550BD|nr:nucleoid-associated protein [Aliivibrio fischeri]